jgi:hypothetical protein
VKEIFPKPCEKDVMKKKYFSEGKDSEREDLVFCTECGISLINFCVSSGVNDINAIKKTFAQCKQTGKLEGRFCAKLFIADDEMLDKMWEELQPPTE